MIIFTWHILIFIFFKKRGYIFLEFVNTKEQLDDDLIKPLNREKFKHIKAKFDMIELN